MRKIKTITSLLLFVSILVSISIINASAVTSYDDFELEYNATTKSYTVVNYVGNSKNVTIPEKVYGRYITKIGKNAFSKNSNVETVEIPYLVDSIDEYAFSECTSLKEITIPTFTRTINQYAFFGCTSLKSVTFNNKITAINDSVFQNCSSLENVVLPSTVEKIGTTAFANCKGLESIKIGNNVSSISTDAFRGCSDKLKIVANDDSYAKQFATENNIAFEEIPPLIGDVNNDGVVDVKDAVYVQRCVNFEEKYDIPSDTLIFRRADVNYDGKINIIDASLIQKFSMHMIDKF